MTEISFKQFCEQIDALARRDGATDPEDSYTRQTGPECWREMYDDGMSPDETWAEECDAAATMLG